MRCRVGLLFLILSIFPIFVSIGVLVLTFLALVCDAFIIDSNGDIVKIVLLNITAMSYIASFEIIIKNSEVE